MSSPSYSSTIGSQQWTRTFMLFGAGKLNTKAEMVLIHVALAAALSALNAYICLITILKEEQFK